MRIKRFWESQKNKKYHAIPDDYLSNSVIRKEKLAFLTYDEMWSIKKMFHETPNETELWSWDYQYQAYRPQNNLLTSSAVIFTFNTRIIIIHKLQDDYYVTTTSSKNSDGISNAGQSNDDLWFLCDELSGLEQYINDSNLL